MTIGMTGTPLKIEKNFLPLILIPEKVDLDSNAVAFKPETP